MKGLKKLLTGILVATMIMGASITAFAEEGANAGANEGSAGIGTPVQSASITVEHKIDPTKGQQEKLITYTYYQILQADIASLTSNDDPTKQSGQAAYFVTDATLADKLGKTGIFTVTKSATEERWNVELTDANTSAATIVAKINTDDIKNAVKVTGTFQNGTATDLKPSATKSGLTPGYYLILSDLGAVAAVQTLGDVKIQEKNSFPGIQKEKATTPDIYAMFGIGNKLKYTLKVEVPPSVENKDVLVVDTASKGLTLDMADNAISVTGGVDDFNLKWESKVPDADPATAYVYTTTIPAATVLANAGKTLTLTYSATINEEAVIYDPQNNTAHIEYDNYKSAETTPVSVKTIGFQIFKYTTKDDKKIALDGAKFSLWKSATGKDEEDQIPVVFVRDDTTKVGEETKAIKIYRVAKANEKVDAIEVSKDGLAEIDGLENANYYLQEDVAPKGFNKLTARKQLVIDADKIAANEICITEVENNSGSVLPSTGGIGTTIFYILGGILIVAGVAYFMVRRKVNAE